jgi:hypothetical protein
MSNDEPAWYETEATARVEPDHLGRLASEVVGVTQPMERLIPAEATTPAFRVGTLAAEGQSAEPFEQARTAAQRSEPLSQGRLVEAEPFEQARTAAHQSEPLRRTSAALPEQQAQPRTGAEAAKRRVSEDGGGGNAGRGFKVDPEQYQAAVSPMLAASEQVRSLYTSLSAFLPSLEAQNPWGNDESGKKFAEGEKGYLKYSKDTLEVFKGLPDALKGIADGLKAMAQGYQGADEAIASDFDGMDTGAYSIPAPPSLPSAPVNNPVHIPVTPRIIQSGRH